MFPPRSMATAPTVPLGRSSGGWPNTSRGSTLRVASWCAASRRRSRSTTRRGRIDRLEPALPREAVRAVPHEEHVLALQHLAREADRVLDPVHARDRADVEVAAVHQRRVHLDAPLAVEHAPEAGVERGVVLEVRDGGLHGVEGAAVVAEDRPPHLDGLAHPVAVGLPLRVRDRPRAAVDDEGRTGRTTLVHSSTIAPVARNARPAPPVKPAHVPVVQVRRDGSGRG